MMQKYGLISIGVFLFLFCNRALGEPFSAAKYDSFLVTFASNGRLNYPAAKASPRMLRDYVAALQTVTSSDVEGWPENEKTAFWINAYNASVIQGILLHYPLDWGNLLLRAKYPRSSIYQIKKFNARVFIQVMGQNWTLQRIRSEIIAKKFQDPRLFFTLVTGRLGDPPLPDRAYSAEKLESQLNRQMRQIAASPKYVQLLPAANKLALAPVFAEFQHRISPPRDWQVREESRRDSLEKIQQDSVRHLLPELVTEAFENYKISFYYQKQASQERLEKRIAALKPEISGNKQELTTLQRVKAANSVLDSGSVGYSAKIEIATSVQMETTLVALNLDPTPVASRAATGDSLIQHFQTQLDALQKMENQCQDSLKIVQASEIDSAKYWQDTFQSLLAEKLAQLPPIPVLKLAQYPQTQQGIIALLMDFAPDGTRNFIRKKHPVIEFLPLKKELNEIVY